MIAEVAIILATVIALIPSKRDKIFKILPENLKTEKSKLAIEKILLQCHHSFLTKPQIAYVLATAWHESNMGNLMEELSSGKQYENRKDLGNTEKGDGVKFKGRGFVQLTGRVNYSFWSKKLGLDLIEKPDQAKEFENASKIIVQGMLKGTFTGKKLSDFISKKTDFYNARRIINGTDKADLIKSYAEKILTVLI